MATISLLFIVVFILVQSAVGIVMLYRGFSLLLESEIVESVTSWLTITFERMKAAIPFVGSLTGWRRAALLIVLFIPGSITLLLLIALWRLAGRFDFAAPWKLSARRLKTAIQNIAL